MNRHTTTHARPTITVAMVLLVALGAAAQLRIRPEQVVTLKLQPARVEAGRTEPFRATLRAHIMEGYHLNSTKPLEKYLIPTRVEIQSEQFELVSVHFPEGELKSFSFSEEKLSVFDGTLSAPLTFKAKKSTLPGDYTVKIIFHYQACNDRLCLRPTKKEINLSVTLH